MKQFARSLLMGGALVCASSAAAVASLLDDVSPFVGIDYQQRWMNGNSDWAKIFPTSYAGGSVYVGGRWDCFAVEFGYDFSGSRHRTRTFGAGETFFNGNIGAVSARTAIQLNGGHIDLIGYVPVVDCLEMMGVVGLGYVFPRINADFGTAFNNNGVTLSGRGTAVARIRFGGNYMVTQCIGIRALVGWESTEYLRLRTGRILSALGATNKGWKSSATVSLGAFVKF